jgi:hypothetical protein
MVKKPDVSGELEALRLKNAELEAKLLSQKPEPFEQIRQASIKNQKGGEQISIRHFTDHKKVSLYHTNGFHIGKKIGPLHPGLLEQTFASHKNKGVVLSTICPSASEIEAYKKTDEYKAIVLKQGEMKPHRNKKASSSETEKTIAAFANLIGVKPSEAIQLKPQEAVVK